jgi:transposase-like protein
VEADKTYIGGKLKNKHRNKLKQATHKDKQPVFGMVVRGGRVIAKVTPDAKVSTVFPIIAERVLPASRVYTAARRRTTLWRPCRKAKFITGSITRPSCTAWTRPHRYA